MRHRKGLLFASVAAVVAVMVGACGGGEATATPPPPKPTNTAAPTAPPPTATPTQAQPTAAPTRPPTTAAPTAIPPTPTPAPSGIPTPVVLPANKRGGTLVTRSLFQPIYWDTWEGFSDVHVVAPMFNSLIHVDPYGDGKAIVGDAAQRWQYSQDGRTITFNLFKNIKFHDGTQMTSKDLAYAFDRGQKPRSAVMTYFKGFFAPIRQIETPDDFTVRVTLTEPSNSFFAGLALPAFQIYPAAYPNPEKFADFKAKPFGTGPFKFKSIDKNVKMSYVRNEGYWKEGLPYLDAVDIIALTPEATVPAFRTGRLDVTNLDNGAIFTSVDDIRKATGFNYRKIIIAWRGVSFNNKAPWTDPRVREAIDLAMDRQAVVDTALLGNGSIYAPPMLPPELGGQWGLTFDMMKSRPGFRLDKRAEDLARAKQLLADAGIDPAKLPAVVVIGSSQLKTDQEAMEAGFRVLGFKTQLNSLDTADLNRRSRVSRDFDVYFPFTGTLTLDDPMEVPASLFRKDGFANYGLWEDASVEAAFVEQDRILDVAKRRQAINDLQYKLMDLRWHLGVMWTQGFVGAQPWAKNFNPHLPFLFQQEFRHEQVWLDR